MKFADSNDWNEKKKRSMEESGVFVRLDASDGRTGQHRLRSGHVALSPSAAQRTPVRQWLLFEFVVALRQRLEPVFDQWQRRSGDLRLSDRLRSELSATVGRRLESDQLFVDKLFRSIDLFQLNCP